MGMWAARNRSAHLRLKPMSSIITAIRGSVVFGGMNISAAAGIWVAKRLPKSRPVLLTRNVRRFTRCRVFPRPAASSSALLAGTKSFFQGDSRRNRGTSCLIVYTAGWIPDQPLRLFSLSCEEILSETLFGIVHFLRLLFPMVDAGFARHLLSLSIRPVYLSEDPVSSPRTILDTTRPRRWMAGIASSDQLAALRRMKLR